MVEYLVLETRVLWVQIPPWSQKIEIVKKNSLDKIIDFESDDKNFIGDFKMNSKKGGKPFIELLQAMWVVNETQSDEEFCEMNGIPKGFFENKVKKNNPYE